MKKKGCTSIWEIINLESYLRIAAEAAALTGGEEKPVVTGQGHRWVDPVQMREHAYAAASHGTARHGIARPRSWSCGGGVGGTRELISEFGDSDCSAGFLSIASLRGLRVRPGRGRWVGRYIRQGPVG